MRKLIFALLLISLVLTACQAAVSASPGTGSAAGKSAFRGPSASNVTSSEYLELIPVSGTVTVPLPSSGIVSSYDPPLTNANGWWELTKGLQLSWGDQPINVLPPFHKKVYFNQTLAASLIGSCTNVVVLRSPTITTTSSVNVVIQTSDYLLMHSYSGGVHTFYLTDESSLMLTAALMAFCNGAKTGEYQRSVNEALSWKADREAALRQMIVQPELPVRIYKQ